MYYLFFFIFYLHLIKQSIYRSGELEVDKMVKKLPLLVIALLLLLILDGYRNSLVSVVL